jgi:hypothetical protein
MAHLNTFHLRSTTIMDVQSVCEKMFSILTKFSDYSNYIYNVCTFFFGFHIVKYIILSLRRSKDQISYIMYYVGFNFSYLNNSNEAKQVNLFSVHLL